MIKIKGVKAREILDSRGNPTIECRMKTTRGETVASVPSGASTGTHEAAELRDGGARYDGKGVLKAAKNVEKAGKKLIGMDASKQEEIDERLLKLDGTKDKSRLGGNAILALSMVACKAGATGPLYQHIAKIYGAKKTRLPSPHFNIINGGKHAGGRLAIQEFMIAPHSDKFSEAVRMAAETYHRLKKLLEHRYGKNAVNIGDEGGFAPPMKTSEEALDMIRDALIATGHKKKTTLAIDAAATSFYKHGQYNIDGEYKTTEEMMEYYQRISKKHNIKSIEDPFEEEDFKAYAELLERTRLQIVGDDLTVTNPARIKKAIENKSCNCLLLKVNQIGTITEALQAARMARKAGWKIMVSHRSGETNDDFIADLAVGISAEQIKAGAPCRGERTAKYNRLMEIEKHRQ